MISFENHDDLQWIESIVIFKDILWKRNQGRPQADAAALGPAPWCLGRLFIFARYTLRLRIQWKRHINFIVNKKRSRQNQRISSRTLEKVVNSRISALL